MPLEWMVSLRQSLQMTRLSSLRNRSLPPLSWWTVFGLILVRSVFGLILARLLSACTRIPQMLNLFGRSLWSMLPVLQVLNYQLLSYSIFLPTSRFILDGLLQRVVLIWTIKPTLTFSSIAVHYDQRNKFSVKKNYCLQHTINYLDMDYQNYKSLAGPSPGEYADNSKWLWSAQNFPAASQISATFQTLPAI